MWLNGGLRLCKTAITWLRSLSAILPLFWRHEVCFCPPPFAKAGDIKTNSSVRPSDCLSVTKTLTWLISFEILMIIDIWDAWSLWQALWFCTMQWPWPSLWPNSRSKLLPGGGPQISTDNEKHTTYQCTRLSNIYDSLFIFLKYV